MLYVFFIIFSPSILIPLSAMYKIANQIAINKNTSCTSPKVFKQFMNSREKIDYSEQVVFVAAFKQNLSVDENISVEDKRILESKSRELGSLHKGICSDIQYFVTGVDSYQKDKISKELPYDIYLFIQTFFISTIGIPVLIIQKYGNWRVVAWMSLYAILSAFIMPVWVILETLNVNISDLDFGIIEIEGTNVNFFLIILVITFFVSLQLIKMLKRNIYSSMLAVNCGILTSMLNLILLGILRAHKDYKHPGHFLPYFLGFLVIYACLFYFQKKMLLRNLSLPKNS